MYKIRVSGSSEYDVVIEPGCLAESGEILRDEVGGEKALIVSDANVAALYLDVLTGSLREAGYETSELVLPAGEETKDIDNYIFLLNILAEREFRGSDLIIALGGGVVGDLVGFAAATFKRGMHCIQVPTSLIAAVDSSVGGKNAINLPTAKNQVGTIRNPKMVICDPECMNTLSEEALHEGYAEIIKYGILNGYEIIDELRTAIDTHDYSETIRQAVTIKRDIVEMDEKDESFRQYLNLGHLIGHAIEANSEYGISHGQAVARGLVLEARFCALAGYIEMSTYLEIRSLLEEFGFELSETYNAAELIPYILRDKRIHNGEIRLLIPEHIGECSMRTVSTTRLEDLVRLI